MWLKIHTRNWYLQLVSTNLLIGKQIALRCAKRLGTMSKYFFVKVPQTSSQFVLLWLLKKRGLWNNVVLKWAKFSLRSLEAIVRPIKTELLFTSAPNLRTNTNCCVQNIVIHKLLRGCPCEKNIRRQSALRLAVVAGLSVAGAGETN